MSNKSVVIVGAGISGLTLAYKLLEARVPYPVVVVEKENEVGGLARSFTYNDGMGGAFTFDIGPHRFYSDNPTVMDFVIDILGDDYIEIGRSSSVWMFNRYYDWPLNISSVFKLPFSLMLKSTVDIIRKKKAKTESFQDFIIEKYGKSLYLVFFKPYTEKFLKYDCSQLHSDWAKTGVNRSVIDNRVKADSLIDVIRSTLIPKPVNTKFIYPVSGGINVFCRYLEQRIRALGGRIVLSSTLTASRTINDIIHSVIVNDSEEIETKFLFWSGPIPVLLRLLDINGMPQLEYLSLVLVNYLVDAPPEQLYQWCYFGAEEAPISRIAIPTMFNPRHAPEGKSGLCVELTCMRGDGLWKHPERMDMAIKEFLVKSKMVIRYSDLIDVKFERIQNAYPIYTLNYPRELNVITGAIRRFKNVLNFGRTGSFWYNNMDHSIEQSINLAKSYVKNPEAFDPEWFKFKRDFTKG